MKFAKELEHELVPEWRAKYLDYKVGKKKVKAISRAIQKANRTPSHPSIRRTPPGQGDQTDTAAGSYLSSSFHRAEKGIEGGDAEYNLAVKSPSLTSRSTPGQRHERQPLRVPGSRFSAVVGSYGSILASPPQHTGPSDAASLELPDPAIDYREDGRDSERNTDRRITPKTPSPVMSRHGSSGAVPRDTTHLSPPTKPPALAGGESKKSTASGTSSRRNSRLLKRVLSTTESPEKLAETEQRSEVERKQDEFIAFLDGELAKIESFYQIKEQEATERLKVLREQLHTMRDQRIQEVLHAKRYRGRESEPQPSEASGGFNSRRIKDAFAGRRIGKNSKALAGMATLGGGQPQDPDAITRRRDFTRQQAEQQPKSEVPYRSAKRKLKYALQEFYRGVELLKSYAYLNRTAFRKINKKYDKVVDTRPSMRYMAEKVNKAWFVQSEVTESLLATAEDLYARYFEGGKRKIAASKLRHTIRKSGDYSPNTFRCGLLGMAGLLFAIQGLIYAGQHIRGGDSRLKVHTSYLLQVSCRLLPA
ncbi:SPX domain-containing protein [Aspergillus aurantiobrunneus]